MINGLLWVIKFCARELNTSKSTLLPRITYLLSTPLLSTSYSKLFLRDPLPHDPPESASAPASASSNQDRKAEGRIGRMRYNCGIINSSQLNIVKKLYL